MPRNNNKPNRRAPKAPITPNAAPDEERPLTAQERVRLPLNVAAEIRIEANRAVAANQIIGAGHLFGAALALELAAKELATAWGVERPPVRAEIVPAMLTLAQACERLGAELWELIATVKATKLQHAATFTTRDTAGQFISGAMLYMPDDVDKLRDVIQSQRAASN